VPGDDYLTNYCRGSA